MPTRGSLTPAMFHILLALSHGEAHGYAVMLEVEELSGGTVKLGPATLYRSIKQLLDLGLIEESEARPDPDEDDDRRRYYRLTPDGEHAAADHAAYLDNLVRAARRSGLVPHPARGGASR